ncbi:MAG: FAD-dependent oxidoreductase [Mariprofundaceae bacterium]|nr:FAD-dependent oxidoreductase [Mariprofundaceae bacterium]
MNHYPYLIIGGGMTGAAAVRGIRKVDAGSRIGVITREPHPPYKRPFLSKALWKGTAYDKVWMKMDTQHVDLHLATSIIRIDRNNRQVLDDQGAVYGYDRLLLATGGTARRLPWDVDGLIYFRELNDYLALKSQAEHGQHFAVIGGGFIGSEIAAALSMNGNRVTMIFPESGIGARIFPAGLSRFLNEDYRSRGVTVLAGEAVASIVRHGDVYEIQARSGGVLHVDGVIAGVGIQCHTGLAKTAGLATDNGILVDEFLRTDDPDIFAAGDVANFFNPALGRRIRVEHEDNAQVMGETAGRNMAGEATPYHHLPFFYSDMFDLGYEAVGLLDADMETVEDWKEKYRQGVVYYLDEGRVRGILLWNTWGHMDAARALIAEHGPFNAQQLRGRLG